MEPSVVVKKRMGVWQYQSYVTRAAATYQLHAMSSSHTQGWPRVHASIELWQLYKHACTHAVLGCYHVHGSCDIMPTRCDA
jgi:hypothetical protein